jgi:hypothetical protein
LTGRRVRSRLISSLRRGLGALRLLVDRRMILAYVVIVFVACVAYTEAGPIRWAEDYCQWKAIHGQSGDVDLVVIGSSRAQQAANAALISEAAQEASGRPWIVYDLARAMRGMGHHHILVKDLLQARDVKRLLVEFNSTDAHVYHDLFYLKAGIGDLWEEISAESQRSLFMRVADAWGRFVKRVAKRWENYLQATRLPPLTLAKVRKAKNTDCVGQRDGVEPSVLLAAEARHGDAWFEHGREWNLDADEERRNSAYVDKLVKLAREHDVELTFFHAVGRYSTIMSQEMLARFEKRYGTRIIQPDTETLRRWFANDDSYNDTSHMTLTGSKYFTDWIVGDLIP